MPRLIAGGMVAECGVSETGSGIVVIAVRSMRRELGGGCGASVTRKGAGDD